LQALKIVGLTTKKTVKTVILSVSLQVSKLIHKPC
jgi:hypothetical protein